MPQSPRVRVHLAIAVDDVERSVEEYTRLLGHAPELVIASEYALFRTAVLNLSIRRTGYGAGTVRHVGFERDDAQRYAQYKDLNGLIWETFSKEHQAEEIRALWPDVDYQPK
jgi:catechol 2,3-dioxygenase-like lactoylglutathione lyase family enzyme